MRNFTSLKKKSTAGKRSRQNDQGARFELKKKREREREIREREREERRIFCWECVRGLIIKNK